MATGNHMPRYFCLLLVTFVYFGTCTSQQFDPLYTGVTYSPLVKMSSGGEGHPLIGNYTGEDIRVMLEIILSKFSKVMTWETGSKSVSYIPNATFSEGPANVLISTIAAEINRKRGSKSLTILQGIWLEDGPRMEVEVRLALECAARANAIYPGTVEGFIFSNMLIASDADRALQTLDYLKTLNNSSVGHLKVGTLMSCLDALKFNATNEEDRRRMTIFRHILLNSDFVVCSFDPKEEFKSKGGEDAFKVLSGYLPLYQKLLRDIKPGLEVMSQLQWSSAGPHPWQNLTNMQEYWEIASRWASLRQFPIWLHEAFDIPVRGNKSHVGHLGWWRLTDNSKSSLKEGYVEKVLEGKQLPIAVTEAAAPAAGTPTAMSVIVVVVVTLGLLVLLVLISVAVLFWRMRTVHQKLSKEDIRQFREGIPDVVGKHQGEDGIPAAIQKCPYDVSLELDRNQIKIDHDKILGMGQFGCVFRATINFSREESKPVALKMAKDGCPRNALKGLLSEIKILSYLGTHPNTVALMGAYTAELHKNVVYIATELCSLGSLQGYLRNKKSFAEVASQAVNLQNNTAETIYYNTAESISLPEMMQWSLEIACGMEYLTTKNVVHADLATRNVLLTEEKTAKITDFGLSRRMYDYTKYIKTEQGPLPWRWMAMESLKKCEFSVKSDVWSYGVTLWEVFSMGDTPYPVATSTRDFVELLAGGLRLGRPTYATPELYGLMTDEGTLEAAALRSASNFQTISIL